MDTSALMMPVELDVRVFDELSRVLETAVDALDFVTPRAVVEELEKLSDGASTEAVAASV
ncbi:MAG: twitching motility protein PilT, partial [Halobacteriota archaeon]